MEKQRQQLNQVIEHVSFFLLCADDVGRMVRLPLVDFQVLVKWEKTELEEVFDDDGDLERKKNTFTNDLYIYL